MTSPSLALDTNCWIYALDDPSSARARWLRNEVLRPAASGQLTVVTPALCLAELLVRPHQAGSGRAAAVRRAVESLPGSLVAALDAAVADLAAEVSATTGLRLADAVVLATARHAGAPLLTNDAALVAAAGSRGLLLDDLLDGSLPRA